jgi:hypothetical protein
MQTKPVTIAIAALALAAATALAVAEPSERPPPKPGNPRLADIMEAAQARHIKLWFAGKARNWELAAYETRQIKARLEDAATLYQSLPVNNLTTMAGPLTAIAAAIYAKDARQFTAAYDELTAGCNSCHGAVERSFINVRTPVSNPFSDQDFAPPRKK